MVKPAWLLAAAIGALTLVVPGSGADARGFGGGFRGGGGGFHGHAGRPGFGYGHRGFHHGHGFRHGHGFHRHGFHGHGFHRHGFHGHGWHRHGWHHRRDGRRFGGVGVPWGVNDRGYGAGGYDDGPRSPREPVYGIPPSPVLPPAIYVIGPKGGAAARGAGPAIRKGRANPIVTSGSPVAGGSSASVIERRHRMN